MRLIDADALKRKAQKVATESWKMKIEAKVETILNQFIDWIDEVPTIQPDNGLQKLADEIASFKRCVKSENSDYLTGYLSALSVVEGMIADMREVTNGD